jgi:hypothetical protein
MAPKTPSQRPAEAPSAPLPATDAVFQAIAMGESVTDVSILMNKAAENLGLSERRRFRGRVLGALDKRDAERAR